MNINLTKQDGFTFLEALISLVISSMVLLLVTSGIVQAKKLKETLILDSAPTTTQTTISADRQIEWHLFLNQLEVYLAETNNPKVSKNAVMVDEWDNESGRYDTISYLRPDSNRTVLIRRKNNGNHRLLTGIETIEFTLKNKATLILDVKFRNGESYTGRIWVDSWEEQEYLRRESD